MTASTTVTMPIKAKTVFQRRPRQDRGRLSATDRGYDSDWRKARARHLQHSPLCVMCNAEERTTAADVVDHIVPIAVDPSRRLDPTNFRSLCTRHHAVVTARFRTHGINQPRAGER
jgi:5-methylcytosine-specific restriction protein A